MKITRHLHHFIKHIHVRNVYYKYTHHFISTKIASYQSSTMLYKIMEYVGYLLKFLFMSALFAGFAGLLVLIFSRGYKILKVKI